MVHSGGSSEACVIMSQIRAVKNNLWVCGSDCEQITTSPGLILWSYAASDLVFSLSLSWRHLVVFGKLCVPSFVLQSSSTEEVLLLRPFYIIQDTVCDCLGWNKQKKRQEGEDDALEIISSAGYWETLLRFACKFSSKERLQSIPEF